MTNRVAIGNIGAGVFGFRISAPGVDALTAGISQQFFDISQESVQVFAEGASIVNDGATAIIPISPAFTYVPFALVQMKRSTGAVSDAWARFDNANGIWTGGFVYDIQPHQLLIENHNLAQATFCYTIFKNKGAA